MSRILKTVRGTTFVYDPKVAIARAVSVTMPVRTASWDTPYGLAPIFDMNLPEGALRAYLMRSFAKATGTFDDFDLLGVVGRTQIGRIRYSDPDAELTEEVPFQSIDEILQARRGGELFQVPAREICRSFRTVRRPTESHDPRHRRAPIVHRRGPTITQLQERHAHREILGANRIPRTRSQRVFLPVCSKNAGFDRARIPAFRRRPCPRRANAST